MPKKWPIQAWCAGDPYNSPSFHMQSKACCEMFHLGGGQHLCKCISNHVIGGAINEVQDALLDDPADPMVVHVNVLGLCVILVVTCKCDGCLIIPS